MSGTDFWSLKRAALRENLAREPLDSFLTWPTIDGTMFVGETEYVRREWQALWAADPARYPAAIGPELGGRPGTNQAHQAYHLYQWERGTGRRVEELESIVEIGGGYGALARVCRALGFAGVYTIYDFPELNVLQRRYLEWAGVGGVECRDDFAGGVEADLLVGLYSLSEMPAAELARYLAGVQARHWLVAVNDAPWEGEDVGRVLAAHFAGGLRVEAPYLPGHYYLIG